MQYTRETKEGRKTQQQNKCKTKTKLENAKRGSLGHISADNNGQHNRVENTHKETRDDGGKRGR